MSVCLHPAVAFATASLARTRPLVFGAQMQGLGTVLGPAACLLASPRPTILLASHAIDSAIYNVNAGLFPKVQQLLTISNDSPWAPPFAA